MSNLTSTKRALPVNPTPRVNRVDRNGPYTFTLKGYDLWITADRSTRLSGTDEDLNKLADLAVRWARSRAFGLYELYRVIGEIGCKSVAVPSANGGEEYEDIDLVGIVTFGESGYPQPRDSEARAKWVAKRQAEVESTNLLIEAVGVTTIDEELPVDEETESAFTAISGAIDREGFLPSGI